jgi:diacylglycerol kinase family enzyme
MPLKAELIVNPCSGGFSKRKIEKVCNILKAKFSTFDVVYTGYAKHAEKIAKQSVADVIFIAGGDGLINEVVNGIIGKDCIVYPLPFGTANVFCREYGILINPIKAAEKVDINDVYKIPLGKVNERIFIKMVGFGYDSAVVNNLNYYLRKINSKLAHFISGIKVLINGKFKPFIVNINGIEIKAYTAIVSLGRKYAGNYNLIKTLFFDGFTICVIDKSGRFPILKNFLSVLFNNGVLGDIYLFKKLQINGASYCQIDGEYFGLTDNINEISVLKSTFYLANCA